MLQSFIRELKPPLSPNQVLLLGEDHEGVGAVCLLAEQGSAAIVKIQAIAVAVRHRGREHKHADEALDIALEVMAHRGHEAGLASVTVVGWIDHRNRASKFMCQRAGFARRRDVDDDLEDWVLELDLNMDEQPEEGLPQAT